jgi:hypothetical protein
MHTTSQYESQESPEYSQLAPKVQKTLLRTNKPDIYKFHAKYSFSNSRTALAMQRPYWRLPISSQRLLGFQNLAEDHKKKNLAESGLSFLWSVVLQPQVETIKVVRCFI